MKRILLAIIGLVTVLLVTLATGWAVTPRQLKEMMAQGDKVTIIDVRSTGMYLQGHIQGAINIPVSIIDKKRLPPIGNVVVCGDGVLDDLALEALDALNLKRGIEAELPGLVLCGVVEGYRIDYADVFGSFAARVPYQPQVDGFGLFDESPLYRACYRFAGQILRFAVFGFYLQFAHLLTCPLAGGLL